jgi:hypothetical protein
MPAPNRAVTGSISAGETNRLPRCRQNLQMPRPYRGRGCRNVSITRPMHRTSSIT